MAALERRRLENRSPDKRLKREGRAVSEAETSYRHTVLDDGGGQGIYLACFREG